MYLIETSFFRQLISLFFLFKIVFSQNNFSGSSLTRYGESKGGLNYSEIIVNANTNFKNYHLWTQFEFSNPPELGFNKNGLRKIQLEHTTPTSRIKLGDIYDIWGRGLILNQIDDQLIDLDNGIRGGELSYVKDYFRADLLLGNSSIWKSTTNFPGSDNFRHNYELKHKIIGSNLVWYRNNLEFGSSFLQSREKHPIYSAPYIDTLKIVHRLYSNRISYFSENFDFYFEYLDKKSENESKKNIPRNGHGMYLNFNKYHEDWAIGLDYVHYDFARLSPDIFVRWNFVDNQGLAIDFQQPPIASMVHSSTLLGRINRQIDFNNNIGYQTTFSGPLFDKTSFILNYSMASRTHEWFSDSLFNWSINHKKLYAPENNPAVLPFEELYFEISGSVFQDRLHFIFGLASTVDVFELYKNIKTENQTSTKYKVRKASTIPIQFNWEFKNGFFTEINYEYQKLTKGTWTKTISNGKIFVDSLRSDFDVYDFETSILTKNPAQFNDFISIGFGNAPNWSLALIIDRVSVDDAFDPNFKDSVTPLESILGKFIKLDNTWSSIELTYNLSSNNRITIMYGSQKGGVLCSNGVCRVIQPFTDGFKVDITSIF